MNWDKRPLIVGIILMIILIAYGCQQISVRARNRVTLALRLQKLREDPLLGARAMPERTAPPPHQGPAKDLNNHRVTLEWSNAPPLWTGVTGLEGSTNLTDWTELTNLPARLGLIRVTLSNRPPVEFYRAFNWF